MKLQFCALVTTFWFAFGECLNDGELNKKLTRDTSNFDRESAVLFPDDPTLVRLDSDEKSSPHQQRYHSTESRSSNFDNYNDYNTSIPLELARKINDYSFSDLFENVIEGGTNLREKPQILQSRFGGVGDDSGISERKSVQLARLAKCMPELKTVHIIKSTDPYVFYYPECTRVERCGGCCSHTLLSCQPTETETITVLVAKTEYTEQKTLKFVSKEPVVVEKHTKCRCGCKIKPQDCSNIQQYSEAECRCLCKNTDEEKKCYKNSGLKLWNPEQCTCQCREVLPCSTGFQYDYNSCKCVEFGQRRRYILDTQRKEQPEYSELHSDKN